MPSKGIGKLDGASVGQWMRSPPAHLLCQQEVPTPLRSGTTCCKLGMWGDSYSTRIASIGSTRVALCAGTNAATVAATIRTTGATVNAIGSCVVTP